VRCTRARGAPGEAEGPPQGRPANDRSRLRLRKDAARRIQAVGAFGLKLGMFSIAVHQPLSASLPGLTRQSMLRLNLRECTRDPRQRLVGMDARVKPAHDEQYVTVFVEDRQSQLARTNKDQA